MVVVEGVCGAFSGDTAARTGSVLRRWRPGVLLVHVGVNDLLNGTEEVIRNLRSIIQTARRNKTVPIIGMLPPAVGQHRGWEPFIQNVNANISALCAEEQVECADHHAAFVSDPAYQASPYNLLTGDGLHPNAAGYELMAKTWRWPLLRVY
jgi:lysophospholipase L1-like esterase